MTPALEKLMFAIGLVDQVTGPAKGICKEINQIKRTADAGFSAIGKGAIGLGAAGLGIYALVSPAQDFNKAMNETRSLGVAEGEMMKLERAGKRFAVTYGESATDFVRSSYDIQSAIAGLTNGELAQFTTAGAVLAKGTKSNAATITNYMGTMFGIFTDQANEMGKGEWVKMLSGQTALAVQMFKTTGDGMSKAWSTLGAVAQQSGVSMAEQMGILGTLQATMPGEQAGTKYKAFLAGVGQAQQELGLKFVDAQGKLLPMVDILEKIKSSKFGDLEKKANMDALAKAFGSQEAVQVITNLIGKSGELKKSIGQLGSVKGMEQAEKMARSMIDPIDRLTQSANVLRISFGQRMLKSLDPLINRLADGFARVEQWTQMFPKLTGYIGVAVLAFFAITAAVAAFTMVMGMVKLVWTAIMVFRVVTTVIKAWSAWQAILNTVLALNPIGMVIYGVIALIAAVGVLIYYWKDLRKWLEGSVFGQVILMYIDNMIDSFKLLWEFAKIAFDLLTGNWSNVSLDGVYEILGRIGDRFQWLTNLGGVLWDGLKAVFTNLGGVIGSLFSKLAKIPGLGFLGSGDTAGASGSGPAAQAPRQSDARKLDIPAGGLQQSVANNRVTNYGGVYISNSGGMGPGELEEMLMMNAG